MITGNKDTDIIVLTKLNDKNFLIFSKFGNKHINKLYKNESLWRDRLFKYYAEIYPEVGETWKNLYLNLAFHMKKYKKNNASFLKACANGHLEVVKYLMSLPGIINPAANDNGAIRWASYNGHLDVVKYLMSLPKQYGINPAAENNWAIHFANRNGHLSVVKYLSSLPKEYGVYL